MNRTPAWRSPVAVLRFDLGRHVLEADSSTAAAFSTGPQHTAPACRPGGGLANVTVPQPPHAGPGKRYSVTFRRISTSMTCAHRGPIGSAPSRGAWHDRQSAGRSAKLGYDFDA
jgi:hypothetical protein